MSHSSRDERMKLRVKYESGFDTLLTHPKLAGILAERGNPVSVLQTIYKWWLKFADGTEYGLSKPFHNDNRKVVSIALDVN
jgi:hypothetical protein